MAAKYEEPDILKCGLCSKLLNTPKSLPCLHMFCEPCLYEFISSVNQLLPDTGRRTFYCPVCETKLSFPAYIKISTFVNQVPSHEDIEAIIKRENLILNGTVCGSCQRRNVIKKTYIWCMECEEGLCEECLKVHATIRTLLSHKTVNVIETKTEHITLNVDNFCIKHERKLDHFCEDHETPCCHTCLTNEHKKCTAVTALNAAASKSKKMKETSTLIQRLEEILDVFDKDVEQREIFLQQIEAERDEMKDKASSFRTEVIRHLDDMETKLDKEIEKLHSDKRTEIKTKTLEFKNTRKIISNYKRLLQILLTRSSDISIFLEKKKIDRKLQEQEDVMAKLFSEPPFKFEYRLSFPPELVKLKTSLKSLGTVKCVEVSPAQLTVSDFTDMPVVYPEEKRKNDQLQELMTFTSNTCDTGYAQGVELLADGRILVTHKNKSLYLLDNKGKLQKELRLPGKPWDVTMINHNEAAVAIRIGFLSGDIVCIINIDDMTIKVKDVLQGIEAEIRGITVHGNKLVLSLPNKIIILLDTKCSLIQTIRTPYSSSFESRRSITALSDKLFCYTDPDGESVVCIDINGSIIFKYTHADLKTPKGITSDSDGVIYVAGHDSNNVHQISSDGKLMRILLCKNDGVAKPRAINFDRSNNKLVVTHSKSKMSIFKVN